MPTSYDDSPMLASRGNFSGLKERVNNSSYKLSWEGFRDARISLTFDPKKVMVTYDFN